MEYDTNCFIKSFARRTRVNLDYIFSSHEYNLNVYEVTQLINSFLGLIIIPYEKFGYKIPTKEEKLKNSKTDQNYNQVLLKKINDILKKCKKENRYINTYQYYDRKSEKLKTESLDDIPRFIKHLRNSVAHGGNTGLRFFPVNKDGGTIDGVIFYDSDSMLVCSVKQWSVSR